MTLKDLLPVASARIGVTRETLNLAVFGLSVPGIPSFVGPFNVHDSRVTVSQPLVDMHALYESRSGSAYLRAAELTTQDTRELVGLAMVDGKIDRRERQMLEAAALHLGLTHRLPELLK